MYSFFSKFTDKSNNTSIIQAIYICINLTPDMVQNDAHNGNKIQVLKYLLNKHLVKMLYFMKNSITIIHYLKHLFLFFCSLDFLATSHVYIQNFRKHRKHQKQVQKESSNISRVPSTSIKLYIKIIW